MPVVSQHHREEPERPKTALLEVTAAALILFILVAVLAMMVLYRPA
ncbi:MAG: hypothetical protein HY820_37275 [Acidobacteria bacterium]|nr:hypothetical protein [Acidobacteriota bacterium]